MPSHGGTSSSAHTTVNVDRLLNVDDFQVAAKRILPVARYEYLASGTDDEQTLHENRWAFKRWFLRPRMMRPIGRITTRTSLFGETMSMPVFVSPAGVHGLCEPVGGECTTASTCDDANVLFCLSQHSTRTIEQVARAAPNATKWYQAYILKNRAVTLHLVQRAVRAGYKGIFLTVDSLRFGYREADDRNGFNALPPPHRLVNYDDTAAELEETYNGKTKGAWDQNIEQMFEQDVTWDDVRWLKMKACPNLPLVVKGIMTAEDAELAIEAGADGIMVSNHGGRQLDGCISSIDALPEVVTAVAGRVPVLLDGGVRRGTDVVKALALGATAVGLGKPIFFALSVGGKKGVARLLALLQKEIEAAMALCGCETVDHIHASLVSRHPAGSATTCYLRSSL
mmetsp:Transcript_24416/g.68034  ORF Transcript_24416/g.68034 Transcript_24416/m.68034 type:complete len:397 (-) Transcript_24416:288-1478(-)